MDIKKYKHEAEYSYTLGMALTIEMIKQKKDFVRKIYIHPNYAMKDEKCNIYHICDASHLPYETNKKIFDRLSVKENVFVLGVFEKYKAPIMSSKPHVVLVNPSDAGNLGTILRTGLGFGFKDFIIIKPGVDICDPKTIRSSMGAFFHIRFDYFDLFEDYKRQFPSHNIYPFMLNGRTNLKDIKIRPQDYLFSLVFGNEGTGLSDDFLDYGESIYIKHSNEIDSLNLSIAFGIAANAFAE